MENLPCENLEEEKKDIALCLLKEKIKSGRFFDLEVISNHSMFPLLIVGDIVTTRNIPL